MPITLRCATIRAALCPLRGNAGSARIKSGSAGFIVEAPPAQRKGFGRVDLRELVRDPDDVLDRAIAVDLDFSAIALPPIAKEVAELLGGKCGIFSLSAICKAQRGPRRPASAWRRTAQASHARW